MIEYISGKLTTLTPTMAVIDNQGIGYGVEISLQTYDALNGKSEATVYIQRQINPRDGIEVDAPYDVYVCRGTLPLHIIPRYE